MKVHRNIHLKKRCAYYILAIVEYIFALLWPFCDKEFFLDMEVLGLGEIVFILNNDGSTLT